VLRPLHCVLCLLVTDCALKLQNRLLRGLGLLVEYRPGLTSLSSLLHVVSSLAQCRFARLPSLVEHDLVFGVVLACRAERVFSLGNVYHCALLVKFLDGKKSYKEAKINRRYLSLL